MKRLLLVAVSLVLALSMASCDLMDDNPFDPDNGNGGGDDDKEQFIPVKVIEGEATRLPEGKSITIESVNETENDVVEFTFLITMDDGTSQSRLTLSAPDNIQGRTGDCLFTLMDFGKFDVTTDGESKWWAFVSVTKVD